MPINFADYVDITSGVGAANIVPNRSLGGLLVTENPLVPTGQILTFTNAADVGTYFGTSSVEYARAVFYFGFVSKSITAPQPLSFWFWPNVATASLIFGKPATYALGTFTSITNGDFTLTMGGFTDHLVGINLSGAASLAGVAALIQTAIRAYSAGGTAWTNATVTFDATRGCFDLVSGATGPDTISVTAGSTTDLASPLGWLTGAILSNGSALQTLTANLTALIAVSNNFGSIAYVPVLNQAQVVEVATWNNALNPNIQFMYTAPVSTSNASAISAAVASIGGVTLTLAPLSTEFPEMCPMMILAATDYTQRNSVKNYMFYQFNLTPSVTNDTDYATYTGLRVNFYGQTQSAGQVINFYQRGYMMGLAVNPAQQNIYANEIWLKDALGALLMNLLLVQEQVPANLTGRAMILAVLQAGINQAIFNGTISVGKTLTINQQLYITQITGSPTAWQQVQNAGYWVDVVIQQYLQNGVNQYKAVYTLVYSKDDVISFIQGSDILI